MNRLEERWSVMRGIRREFSGKKQVIAKTTFISPNKAPILNKVVPAKSKSKEIVDVDVCVGEVCFITWRAHKKSA
jgi:hypothetical protein